MQEEEMVFLTLNPNQILKLLVYFAVKLFDLEIPI